MMDQQPFYDYVTEHLFKGSLPAWQKEPLSLILAEGVRRERRVTECAYVLATAHHETARFKFMEEIGQGQGRDYGRPVTLIRGRSVTYHGRGFVQLTWLLNYLKMERKLGLKLVDNPDTVSDPEVACQIIWEGMIAGDFTGKNLADYFSDQTTDYVNARRIVNGMDKAGLIAQYARHYDNALRLVGT